MARPVNANAELTRSRVLNAALNLFSDRGVDGTSIRDIGREADVSLATVHHYFGSKEDLVDHCLDSVYLAMAELQPRLLPVLAAASSHDELVEKLVRTYFRFAREHQANVRLLMRTVIDQGELDEKRRRIYQMPFLAVGAERLAEVLQVPPASLRLRLQSIVHMTVRYALSTEREIREIAGIKGTDSEVLLHIEDHLVDLAKRILLN